MQPNFRIRPAEPTDVPVIHQVAAATWWATYASFVSADQLDYMFEVIYQPEALERQMAGGQAFLLLFAGEEAAGFASFSLKEPEQRVYQLNKLYLHPSQQGKGLGQALISAVEEQVRQRGGNVLDLNVNRHNPARKFYERCGFTILHEEDIPIGPHWMNDYVMRKKLA